jgi:co-chaperonin GroES (HSP10)
MTKGTNNVRAKITLTNEQEDRFPAIEPGVMPLGTRVLVQLRTPVTKSKGGILITEDSRDFEKWNTQIGLVVAVGPVAFKNRTTMEPWPEGQWVQPGDFVRVPKHGGDKFEVPLPPELAQQIRGEAALFVTFNDHEMISKITGNPLDAKVYI